MLFATGALVGALNGFLIVRLRLNAFIVTLAMLILLRGVTLGITNGKTLFDLPRRLPLSGLGQVAGRAGLDLDRGRPLPRWSACSCATTAPAARSTRSAAIAEAARAAGIRVERITWGLYVVGGLLAALAGLMLTGRIASVVASQGQNMIFYVFAAAVIGGISLNGGRGRLLGALTGVLLLGILQNVLTLSQIAGVLDRCRLRR